ncbi:16S rRNA (cytidine(1402)-2'-O)-methyltransferase [Methylomarinum sp. Ch1-1]|uniref:Ribosomal RNA small subunit methyltransferase I n=1 Tax=Methylomarinum roseum TaxID=3067653 RepID=A0AAU7NXM6_9GAMM|nr:16S rRNA (cytidine(1402)-2'-O)-methyltransferase [Methylomarinum sp. Ch1-1]MDP4522177.1 16S rRNA (cytidine(1402)-2'-O)-methyltransferase [Methylomarinum sp. Ch1-1]
MPGKLYVVATPIGNLADFSHRAVEILQQVDMIAAEDTRHVRMLLQHYGISKRLISLHQHNEDKVAPKLVEKMQQGLTIALVSDAGTPLLSDPGLPLVRLAREQGIDVSPVPGACALIAALSVSGLPVSRFTFEGFLPRTTGARKAFFRERLLEPATWVFYESSHRIQAALEDMLEIFPADRQIVLARELTKLHETIVKDQLAVVFERVKNDGNMRKGEFVVVVEGAKVDKHKQEISEEERRILALLLQHCSIKTAVTLAVEMTGQRKKLLYQAALTLANDG